MKRYQVYGFYNDEPQVVVDVVDAESAEEAEEKIKHARAADQGSGYTSDGASLLEEELENIHDIMQRPAEVIQREIDALATYYREEDQ